LGEVFRRADVVSLHTPWLPETERMITGEHFAMMKPNKVFINTARDAVVRENEMISAGEYHQPRHAHGLFEMNARAMRRFGKP